MSTRPGAGAAPTELAEQVLAVVATVPRGRVVTYGDVAEAVGRPRAWRAVGSVLADHGHDAVPWQRVVRADGRPARSAPAEALRRLAAEGVPLVAGGDRVDLRAARWEGLEQPAVR